MTSDAGRVLRKVDVEGGELIVDLATDENTLYAVSYGWTKGDPIYRFDLATLSFEGRIVTEANLKNRHSGTGGLAAAKGSLPNSRA